ncbi:MAG TPA: RdgB/HAM1 family non-canonical purine NTP pyrophosphatase [Candidatus Nanoarchaeia archaeon]
MKKILIATHSEGKLQEYKSYLGQLNYEIVSLADLGVKDVSPEEGDTFLEVAQNKALFYSKFSKLPIVAEDSGLEIHALHGFPGVLSDRWMEGDASEKNLSIIKKMGGIPDRKAIFKAVLVYLHKKMCLSFEGQVSGEIAIKPEGVMGFGYDPIFYVPLKKRTMAQITLPEKNQISHRAQALQKLASYLRKYKPE